MKRIYFNQLNSRGNLLILFLGFVALMTTILSNFEYISLDKQQSDAVFVILIFILIYRGTPEFILKNYVQWNQHGILIKINSFSGLNLNFQMITHLDFAKDKITINTIGKQFHLDLKSIDERDQEHLKKILRENINTNYISEHLF